MLWYHGGIMDTNIDIEQLKAKLEEERQSLEGELASVGRRNPKNPSDWEPTPDAVEVAPGDQSELADKMEDFEDRAAVEVELENRLAEVNQALLRIAAGTYGRCETGSEPIEAERLLANPAARTCIKHRNG